MRSVVKVLGVLAVVVFGSASTARAQVDLSLTATDAPDPVAAGAQLTYTFQVQSLGPNAAGFAGWSAGIPTGSTFVSLSNFGGGAWNCNTPAVGATGGVNCNVQTFPLTDGPIIFTLVVAVNSNLADGAMLNLNAYIFNEGGGQDTNMTNNNVSLATTVGASSGSSSGPAVSSSQGVASSTGASGSTAGTSTAGTSTAGTSVAGTSTAGTSTAGTSVAGTSTAGTSTAGTSTAGTSTAGTSGASSGVATSRPASSGGGSSVMASSRASSGATSVAGGSSTGGSSSTPASSTSQAGGGDDGGGGGFNLLDFFSCEDSAASAAQPGLLSPALLLLVGWRWRRRGARTTR